MKRDESYFIKKINEINILRVIRDDGPISRAEIARRLGVSKPLVGIIVNRLLELGVCFETGRGTSTNRGGRPPILLQFNADAWYAVGIEIQLHQANVLITNINAETVARKSMSYQDNRDVEHILRRLVALIKKMLPEPEKQSRILGVGITLPGLIDYDEGVLRYADTLKTWEGYRIRAYLERHLDTRVYLENDVKAITLGEFHWGAGTDAGNLIYVWIGEGLGGGLIMNGEIYRGISGSAGEIGYSEISPGILNVGDYPLLYQGQSRYGEVLNTRHLLSSIKKALITHQYNSRLNGEDLSTKIVLKAASAGDELAVKALRELGALLGHLLINIINILNPELIVVGGPLIDGSRIVLDSAESQVKKDTLALPAQQVQIRAGILKDKAGVLGAVGLVLQDLFKPPIVNLGAYRSLISFPQD